MATVYLTPASYSGVTLHIIRAEAEDIEIVSLMEDRKSLANSGYYGINGGFFDMGGTYNMYNIAVQNGTYVGPYIDPVANGFGNSVGKGVIYWDGSDLNFAFSVTYANELVGYYEDPNVWMQGGIALWLGSNQWEQNVRNQGVGAAQYLSGSAQRTGMVANMSTGQVHLIVAPASVTVSAFRAAIQAYLGITDGSQANTTYQALLLDGGGSTQMRALNQNGSTVNVTSSSRALSQIVRLTSLN